MLSIKVRRFLFLLCPLIFVGCGSTQSANTNILNFDGKGGVILVEGAALGREEQTAKFSSHSYCLSMPNGYGIKDFYSQGSGRYKFSCVIKTPEEANASPVAVAATVTDTEKNSNDSKTQCKEFGFSEGTPNFSNCVLQLELAKRTSAEIEERYRAEQAQYERQLAAIEREKERRRGAAFLELGARIMGGQRPIEALGSLGTGAPIAPTRPSPINQTITLPNGRMINCSTMGTMTNCF
ncbi:MAG: hypothetical protein HEQ17_14835 [Limnohabitans sp.]|uniref:hypothetical protein n=1 Tax=Limnohabitans sp. TaxID=1907725 RepID=UPI0025DE7FE4|nr:hypothetical protein [Limnohabitans sp.]MCO4090134.1 hypothetical protein [Limnohabitans sp.]